MSDVSKPRSPFSPGQPAAADVFVGRKAELGRLLERGAAQTSLGKPTAFFVEGEYGIGKSSLADACALAAERRFNLLRVRTSLAGVKDVAGVAETVLKSVILSAASSKSRWDRVKDAFGKIVKGVNLFGVVELDVDAVKRDATTYASVDGFVAFLRGLADRLASAKEDPTCGFCIVLDEINGIAAEPMFAHFLKGVVDANALSSRPVALMLVLCGTPDRRRQLIASHEPVGRIFEVIEVLPLSAEDSATFLTNAFSSVRLSVTPSALTQLVKYGAGQPRILHLLGDQAFWCDDDGVIDDMDVHSAVVAAAEELGRKYVDPQVLAACRSKDYRSILAKIADINPLHDRFSKKDVARGLSASESGKLSNFLQRMKELGVLRSGETTGEYVFTTLLVRTAIWLFSQTDRSQPSDAT